MTKETTLPDRRGEKIGWIGGWSGGFVWVVILSVMLLIQNKWTQGLFGMLLVALAALSIFSLAPWRHPSTPYWKLMVPIYTILFGTLVWATWIYWGIKDSGLNWWTFLFFLALLLMPFVSVGKKTWNDFNHQMNSSVQDTTRMRQQCIPSS